MKKLILILSLIFISATSVAEQLSDIQTSGSWIYLYNTAGKKYKTLSVSSVGQIEGFSSSFFVSKKSGWIYLYDADGKRYKTMSVSTVGDVISVAGNTFTSRKGNWIYTWSRDGKKLNTRSAPSR